LYPDVVDIDIAPVLDHQKVFCWAQAGPVSINVRSIERVIASRELEIPAQQQQYWVFRSREACAGLALYELRFRHTTQAF